MKLLKSFATAVAAVAMLAGTADRWRTLRALYNDYSRRRERPILASGAKRW